MAQAEQLQSGLYRVSGKLDYSTVVALLTQIHTLSGHEREMTLDFSGLEHSNSAGLALLMELLADAKRQNRLVHFKGIPEKLLDLARMSNVDHLLTK